MVSKPTLILTSGTCLLLLGVALLAVGLALGPIVMHSVNERLYKNVGIAVTDDPFNSDFQLWSNQTDPRFPPLYRSFYLWNITNPEAVRLGEKISVKEVGPYTYRFYEQRYDVNYTDDGRRAQFKTYYFQEFVPSMSGPNLTINDRLTLVNIPYVTVMQQALNTEYNLRLAMASMWVAPSSNVSNAGSVLMSLPPTASPLPGLGIGSPADRTAQLQEWAGITNTGSITNQFKFISDPNTAIGSPLTLNQARLIFDTATASLIPGVPSGSPIHLSAGPVGFGTAVAVFSSCISNFLTCFVLGNYGITSNQQNQARQMMNWFERILNPMPGMSAATTPPGFTQSLLNGIFQQAGGSLFATRTVDQWIYGAPDPLLTLALQTPTNFSFYSRDGLSDINPLQPPVIPGKLYDEAYTGIDDNLNKATHYYKWQEKDIIPYYPAQENVTGAPTKYYFGAGSADYFKWDAHIEKDSILQPFEPLLYRTLPFEYESFQHVCGGVKAYRFRFADSLFNSSNRGFDQELHGLLNLTSPKHAPVFISKPHHYGYPEYAEDVEGVTTEESEENAQDLYDTYLDVEPNTGLTVRGHARTQVNTFVKRPLDGLYSNLSSGPTNRADSVNGALLVPAIWTDEFSEYQGYSCDQLTAAYSAWKASSVMFYLGVILGPLLMILGFTLMWIGCVKRRREKRIKKFQNRPTIATLPYTGATIVQG